MNNEQEKRDNENYARNFTRVCNILLDSYKHLTYEEKFLYIKMREIYWDAKPRFATLREISHLTGFAISALSRILPRLNACGLIHAEIKQEFNPDGSKKGNPKYYISILDIWELNRKYYECSPEERFDPSVVLQKNEVVLQKNEVVLQKNEVVLQKNRVISPEEQHRGTQPSSQARSQLSKDKKDIIKIERKNEGDPTSENPQESLTHSSTPSSLSSQVIPSVEKLSTAPTSAPAPAQEKLALTAEEERIHGYWLALGFEAEITPKLKEHWGKLSKHVQSQEEMKSLYESARRQLEQSQAKDKTVYPGNLVKSLNGWKQAHASKPSATSSKPILTSMSGMRNYSFDPEPPKKAPTEETGTLVKLPEFKFRRIPKPSVVQQ